jgi:Rad3-related DNA helicase
VVASAPLRVDETLRERLYEGKRSVILTGATLAVQGSFDYLRAAGAGRRGRAAAGLAVRLPAGALLLVPSDMPEPGWPDYTALSRALVELARRPAGGRWRCSPRTRRCDAYGLAKGRCRRRDRVFAQGWTARRGTWCRC